MKRFFLCFLMSIAFTASPFYDSSVYVQGQQVNIKENPADNSKVVFVAKKNMAFKYIETVVTKNNTWYKVEFYNPTKYDTYYKPNITPAINPNNFNNMTELYKTPDVSSAVIRVMVTNRNYKAIDGNNENNGWKEIQLIKPQIGFVSSVLVNKIKRPYFLVETALDAIAKNRWGGNIKQKILNGEIDRDMTPSMIKAIKGEPDNIYEDKTGRSLYYTWIYGGQAINFRNHLVTSW